MAKGSECKWKDLLSTRPDVSIAALRILMGWTFFQAGLGKVFQIGNWILPASYFEKIGIPFSGFIFHFVGWIELICGLLLILGLFTRLAAVPVMIIIFGAIMTVHREMGHAYPLVIFTVCCALIINGSGRCSLDGLLANKCDNK